MTPSSTQPAHTPTGRYRAAVRASAIVLGLAVLLWLSIEDASIRWVSLLSLLACLLAAVSLGISWKKINARWYWYPAIGVLFGFLVAPMALLLMAIKTGLHGHLAPDFSPTQVSSVINSTPLWVVMGLLLGIAAAVGRKLAK